MIPAARIALALALVGLAVGSATPANAAPRPLTTGISNLGLQARPLATGLTTTDVNSFESLAYERTRAAGARFIRIMAYWSTIAPGNEPGEWDPSDSFDPAYDFSYVDDQVRLATEAGLVPLVILYSAPRWAERCRDETPGICNPDPKDFEDFSEAIVDRYSGKHPGMPRVRYWEPWNEPNLFLFFKPQFRGERKVSPLLYRELLNRFHSTVKRVDPSNLVVAGGLAPLERPGGLGPLDFTRRLFCMTGRAKPRPTPGCKAVAKADIWAVNPYTTGGPTHQSAGPDDVSLGDLPEMMNLLRAAKKTGKIRSVYRRVPLWVTEFSWDSKPPDPGGVEMKRLTRWTTEAMYRAWRAGVSKFFWLSLRDWPRAEGLPFSQTIESGLYFRGKTLEQDRPKAILRAFRFPFVAFRNRGSIHVWGRTPDSGSGPVVIQYRRGSWRTRLGVVRAGPNGIFSLVFRTRRGADRKGALMAWYGSDRSIAFPLRRERDRRQPPFGWPNR